MKTNLTVAKKQVDGIRKRPTITFYSLLEKYNGDIKQATESELKRVHPNGLKALFKAWRVYDQFKDTNENAPVGKTSASTNKPNLTS